MIQNEDPFMLLIEAMLTGDPSQAIVNQEKRGQRDMVSKSVLPIEMRGITKTELEGMGFVFGKSDDLFIETTLPDRWEKRGSDHDMWSYLHDAMGNERAAIFYKAAFYDRSAFLSWNKQ